MGEPNHDHTAACRSLRLPDKRVVSELLRAMPAGRRTLLTTLVTSVMDGLRQIARRSAAARGRGTGVGAA